MSGQLSHTPVMCDPMLTLIAPKDGGVYVDGTFGGGGYSRALLEAAVCTVYAIDRDAAALRAGASLAAQFSDRLVLIHGRFSDMERLLAAYDVTAVDGIALDLGLSSRQLDDADRGFSFRFDGPLDMRMNRDEARETAADLVNSASEGELAAIIKRFGEERRARGIARAIVAARAEAPITRSGELATIVRGASGRARDGIDPATRTFQALRIQVNDEIGEIERGLCCIERLLRPTGRAVVVAFHSLEDRPVKRFFRERSGTAARPSRHQPDLATKLPDPSFKLLTRRARKPSDAECAANPRARSARLRAVERTDAPAWQERQAA
jgi:16S rRNA (cytosine1402-N4)-methyltransferase